MHQILASALGQDVSTLAAQEKQLLLSRLLARFAHEIRNPLSSLGIHVQLLEEDLAATAPQLREKAGGRLEIIRGELHRLEAIVKHFLSLAAPSSLNRQAVVVGKIVAHVGDLLRPEARVRGIEVVLDSALELPEIQADPVQLTQALLNLVINAMQAMPRGGRIEIRSRFEPMDRALVIEVQDNGPGVPPERQSAIFEPFFSTKAEGSGLGLWIVQQIITAHGGSIGVANAPGGGARFTVRLPAAVP